MQLKKLLTQITKIIFGVFAVAYPFIVFWALKKDIALKFIGFVLLLSVIFSWTRSKNTILFILGLLLCLSIIFFNQEIFVKLYPVLMNTGVFALFAVSLKKTPLVTKFAEKMHKTMDEATIKYTRNATYAWAIVMGCNAVVSFITIFLSDEIWTLYNGLVSYMVIGTTMLIEYIIRKKVFHDKSDK